MLYYLTNCPKCKQVQANRTNIGLSRAIFNCRDASCGLKRKVSEMGTLKQSNNPKFIYQLVKEYKKEIELMN